MDHRDYETDELLVNSRDETPVSTCSHPGAFEVFTEYKFRYFFRKEAKRNFLQCCKRFRLASFGEHDIGLPYLAVAAHKSVFREHPFDLILDLRGVYAVDFKEEFEVQLPFVKKLRFYPSVAAS